VETWVTSSWLNPLREMSLLKSRGGSLLIFWRLFSAQMPTNYIAPTLEAQKWKR